MSRFQFLQLSLSALLLCCAGCSGGTPANFGMVEGTVTLDGAPLAQASVTYYPNSGERSSVGKTDENGAYSLRHTRDIDGAVIGKHTVTFSVNSEEEDEEKKETISLKYGDRKKTDQNATVESGTNNINFDLKSK